LRTLIDSRSIRALIDLVICLDLKKTPIELTEHLMTNRRGKTKSLKMIENVTVMMNKILQTLLRMETNRLKFQVI